MKKYNKENGRKNMRLRGYDYSRAGLYFLTIAVQNRLHLFGNVRNGEMILNDAGQMVEKWYYEIENKYPDKRCHEMVVMPNHFHCIIENLESDNRISDNPVRAPLRGRSDDNDHPDGDDRPPKYGIHNKKYGASIPDVMDWFKTMTTNAYIRGVKNNHWQRFDKKLWQRNYFDRIIRNHSSYQRIAHYILNNPQKWSDDRFNNGKNKI